MTIDLVFYYRILGSQSASRNLQLREQVIGICNSGIDLFNQDYKSWFIWIRHFKCRIAGIGITNPVLSGFDTEYSVSNSFYFTKAFSL
jgi:hypothetical protein